MKSAQNALDSLRDTLLGFKESRLEAKALAERVKQLQPELITVMGSLDPGNDGIIFDESDTATGTAFIQQNRPSEFWDVEGIITYLKKNKSLWMSCSSRVFDNGKWEAEIANGNIPASVAKKFKKQGLPPAPFIRFGKAKDESL